MYPTHSVICLDAITHNFLRFKTLLNGSVPVPVIKSDAYGHGAVKVAQTLEAAGATRFAVFRVEEAMILREAGISTPIWVLLGALPEEIPTALGQNLTLACWSLDIARELNAQAAKRHVLQNIHLKIDTGMGRLGFLPEQIPDVLPQLLAMDNLRLTGAFSHMAKADDPLHPVTVRQPAAFLKALSFLPQSCAERHLSATPAIARHVLPELPFARPGIGIYGISPEKDLDLGLRPAMTLVSKIISLKDLPKGYTISYNCTVQLQRDSRIGVVPIGYSSGLPRALTNRAKGIVRGKIVPNLGTICMDMTMFDLTDVPDAQAGDEIVLMGRQGEQEISAWELASLANTIPYELICAIGATQPREYR